MLEHRLRPQEPRDDRHRGDAVRLELRRHVERVPLERQLHRLRQRVAAGRQRVAFGDFDDQAAPRANHQRRGVLGGDDVRQDRLAEHRFAVREVCFPERSPLPHHRILASNAVDEDVEAVVLAIDPCDQRLDLRFDRCDRRERRTRGRRRGRSVSAVSSIVSGRLYGDGLPRMLRPVQ